MEATRAAALGKRREIMNLLFASQLGFIGSSMSGGEIFIVLIAALLLFGSKNLPSIARNLGKSLESFRKASREVTDEIMRADLDDDKPPARATKPVTLPAEAAPAPKDEQELTVTPSANTVERNGSERT